MAKFNLIRRSLDAAVGTLIGEPELGIGLDGRGEGDPGFLRINYVTLEVPGSGTSTGRLSLKSITASFLSSSAAQQLKKGFFFYTG
jgi:hypothetical protein